MKKKTILGVLREQFNESRSNRLVEMHDDAVRYLHRLEADRVFVVKMRDFYVEQKLKLDPDKQWVEHCNIRQKQDDFETEILIVDKKIDEQRARVNARCAALKAHNDVC